MSFNINKEIFNLTKYLTGFLTEYSEESIQIRRVTDLNTFKSKKEQNNLKIIHAEQTGLQHICKARVNRAPLERKYF